MPPDAMLQQEFNFRSLMVKDEAGAYRLATGEEIMGCDDHWNEKSR